ncbi:MAG: type IX secretion system outer membrane channel protein PorV [Paludibacteraceae bacterium]|nr:type IX secretion system outer membrane channel protein PorV [Bacteroidales bacterium]
MKKVFVTLMSIALMAMPAMAEEVMNPIITAMPSLSIAPDAHAGGLGDVGAATTPDLNSQHWNPAKYAFMESHGGITANYTPWLTKLVNDIDLAYIAGYYNISERAGALGMSFTYFSLGEVQLTNFEGDPIVNAAPNEWALDLSYSRKLHEYVSMAVAMRFLYSDMNNGVNAGNTGSSMEMYPGWTMAADVALYYRQPFELPMGTSYFALGLNISNLGGKISYDQNNTSSFIPANLRLGASYELAFDNYNRLSINADVNKYLVPASKGSKFAVDENGNPLEGQALKNWYYNLSSPKGWYQSFADAPGGFKEEMRELQYGVGLEYSYDRKFFGRVGYSHENKWKGNRRYVTIGAGFHLSIVTLDVSYVIATAATNPLDNTLRFSLGFDLAGIKDLVNNKK